MDAGATAIRALDRAREAFRLDSVERAATRALAVIPGVETTGRSGVFSELEPEVGLDEIEKGRL